jgi:hypothetical protein
MSKKTILPTSIKTPKRGDRVKAKDIQELAKQIKRVTRSGRENYVGAFYRAPDAPFTPKLRGKKDDPQAYEIALSKGYVIERRIPDGQALIYHFPTGIVDDEGKAIYHDISEGQAVYVQVQVEDNGTIEFDPIVLVAEDELEGEHFRPEVFDFGGNAGTHNYKIAKFEMVNEKPRLKLFCAGDNVDHYDERVGMINVKVEEAGDFYNIGKTYESGDDKIHFRSLQQLDDDGEPIIKAGEESAPELDSIQFRRIKDKGSDAQIHVRDSGNAIMIEGNGVTDSITAANKVSVSVVDGLVTELSAVDTNGWWGTILHQFFTSITESEPYTQLQLEFEAGMLVSVLTQAPAQGFVIVPGTENAPGAAIHSTHASNT